MSLPVAGGLELDNLQGPLQPKFFYDSVIIDHSYWRTFFSCWSVCPSIVSQNISLCLITCFPNITCVTPRCFIVICGFKPTKNVSIWEVTAGVSRLFLLIRLLVSRDSCYGHNKAVTDISHSCDGQALF